MSLNILVDDSLINEALKFSSIKSKNELIQQALKEYIVNQKRRRLLKLKGKIDFFDDYDYKSMRGIS